MTLDLALSFGKAYWCYSRFQTWCQTYYSISPLLAVSEPFANILEYSFHNMSLVLSYSHNIWYSRSPVSFCCGINFLLPAQKIHYSWRRQKSSLVLHLFSSSKMNDLLSITFTVKNIAFTVFEYSDFGCFIYEYWFLHKGTISALLLFFWWMSTLILALRWVTAGTA